MKLFTTTLFLCFLIISCCWRERCNVYHYHRSFPRAYYGAAEYAVGRWSFFSGNRVTIDRGDPEEVSCAFQAISQYSEEYREYREAQGDDFWGLHLGCSGSIVIVPDSFEIQCKDDSTLCARSILLHEIAHEFDLEHVEDPGAVMASAASGAQEYTARDLQECLRVRTCR